MGPTQEIVRVLRAPYAGVALLTARTPASRVVMLRFATPCGGFAETFAPRAMVERCGIVPTEPEERFAFVLSLLSPVARREALALMFEACQDAAEAWEEVSAEKADALRWLADLGSAAVR